jgi:hypothetical protein
MNKTEFGITIKSTQTPGVYRVSGKMDGIKKTAMLVQPVYAVQLGMEPTIDQAIDSLRYAR